MTTSTTNTVARLTLIAMLAVSAIAFADSPGGRGSPALASTTVSFKDLNVASPEGARVLYGRIRAAAQRVCGPNSAPWFPGPSFSWKKCCAESVDRAVKELNRPMLTALHHKRVRLANR